VPSARKRKADLPVASAELVVFEDRPGLGPAGVRERAGQRQADFRQAGGHRYGPGKTLVAILGRQPAPAAAGESAEGRPHEQR
jgi:hypothetical protein